MSWDDFGEKTYVNDNVKKPIYRATNGSHFYCVFRIGRKYRQTNGITDSGLNMVKGFQKHMEREISVTNADLTVKNEILIGDKNIYEIVKEYTKDIKLRKNGVVARELLMTASPDFFRQLSHQDLISWKEKNIKWLKDNYGENCVYATLHKDESTWHIHALIVPRFKNNKNEYILSNSRYFDGIEKMRGWQDNYANNMQSTFKNLNRGIRYSKAKHMEIKHYYALINQKVNEKDINQLTAKAKNEELLKIKIQAIEKTLQLYKDYNSKSLIEKEKAIQESKNLAAEISEIKGNDENYKEAISLLSQQYKIPQYAIKNAIRFAQNINEKEK